MDAPLLCSRRLVEVTAVLCLHSRYECRTHKKKLNYNRPNFFDNILEMLRYLSYNFTKIFLPETFLKLEINTGEHSYTVIIVISMTLSFSVLRVVTVVLCISKKGDDNPSYHEIIPNNTAVAPLRPDKAPLTKIIRV